MKPKQRVIQGKELFKQIAEGSDYYAYEIEDVLSWLAATIAENANQGYNTCIRGIGTFSFKPGYHLKGKSAITGSKFNVMTKNSLSLKIDSYMKNTLNQGCDRKNTLNTNNTLNKAIDEHS